MTFSKEMKNWMVMIVIGLVVIVSSFSISYDGTIISSKLAKFLKTDVTSIIHNTNNKEQR